MATNRFGEDVARRYDAREGNRPVAAAVEFLAGLAGSGPALEMGIGTGRVALPLSQRGVAVHGIDLSRAMVARLREKPGGTAIPVTIGDFATTRVPGEFSLVYLVYNTITNLTSQDAQVACFANAAAHLAAGGHFVIENYIPFLRRLPPGETIHPFDVTPTHLGFEEYDFATQMAISHHYWIEDGRVEASAEPYRYVWPSELDLMARLAGMRLVERWADWNRTPFTGESTSHVSVWRRAGSA
jgi:hypothetical protein